MAARLVDAGQLVNALQAWAKLIESGKSYEEVCILQVSTQGITFGEASKKIELLEKLTGKKLPRGGDSDAN